MTWQQGLLGFAAGLLISIVTAPVGISGAVFLLPVQLDVLHVPNPQTTPTNLLFNIIAGPGALARYHRHHRFTGPLARQLITGTAPGVIIRVYVASGLTLFRRATDVTADLLLDMAHQALHLRRPHEALSLVQLGYGVAASRTHPMSACTASYLASNQAWCHAAQGDARACDRALGQAIEHFSQADPGAAAPGTTHVDTAELAAQQGHAYYTLALATAEVKHAARAVPSPRGSRRVRAGLRPLPRGEPRRPGRSTGAFRRPRHSRAHQSPCGRRDHRTRLTPGLRPAAHP